MKQVCYFYKFRNLKKFSVPNDDNFRIDGALISFSVIYWVCTYVIEFKVLNGVNLCLCRHSYTIGISELNWLIE